MRNTSNGCWNRRKTNKLQNLIKNSMNVIKTNIDGVLIIEPRLFRDARGYFFRELQRARV